MKNNYEEKTRIKIYLLILTCILAFIIFPINIKAYTYKIPSHYYLYKKNNLIKNNRKSSSSSNRLSYPSSRSHTNTYTHIHRHYRTYYNYDNNLKCKMFIYEKTITQTVTVKKYTKSSRTVHVRVTVTTKTYQTKYRQYQTDRI